MSTPKTYYTPRSSVFGQVLKSKGYKENKKEPDVYYGLDESNAIVKNLPQKITGRFCSKKLFYLYLQSVANLEFIPPTYTYHKDVPETQDLWFVKGSYGSRGEQVIPCRGRQEITSALEKLNTSEYVIQREVKNPDLIGNRKYTLRVYLLHTGDGKVYVYKRILCILHTQPYKESSNSHEIHVNHDTAERKEFSKCHRQHTPITDSILDVCKKVYSSYRSVVPVHNRGYHLYGLDFIIDQEMKPWLIEMNGFPNVESHEKDVRNSILTSLFDDLYYLWIREEGDKKYPGSFINIL